MDERNIEYVLSESIALFRTAKLSNLDSAFVKSAEFSIMIIIYHTPNNISAVDISNYLHCSKVYVSRIINILIAKKYVEKKQNTLDGRQYYLFLTDEGHKIVQEYKEKYMEITNYLYLRLGPNKSKLFIDLLNESRQIINEYEKNKL